MSRPGQNLFGGIRRGVLLGVLSLGVAVVLTACGAGAGARGATPTARLLPPSTFAAPATVDSQPTAEPLPSATVMPSPTPEASPSPRPSPMPRVMALGVRSALVLRAAPQAGAARVAQVSGGDVVWLEGRSQNGAWFWVTVANTGTQGWAAASEVRPFGSTAALAAVERTAAVPTPRPAPAVSGGAARPAPAGAAGAVAFETAPGGDIYLVNADGSGLRRIASGFDPTFSPDGAMLAYTKWSQPYAVYVLDLRTGAERQVATADRPRGPSWSADGTRLAYTYITKEYFCRDLGFICAEDQKIREIIGGDCIDLPLQGRKCIKDFPLTHVEENGLNLVGLGGEPLGTLLSDGTVQSLSWRPGQDDLVFRGKEGLQQIRPGEPPRPLINDRRIGSPSWSPDGTQIVAHVRLHDHEDVFLLDTAGNPVKQLTVPPPTYDRAPGQPPANNVAPAWSPDGKSILFLSDRDGSWKLYRMNADGSGQALFLPNVLGGITLRYDYAAERVVTWGRAVH